MDPRNNGVNESYVDKTAGSKTSAASKQEESFQVKAPEINLPKGGGAIKGIEEKFNVNAATGAASFSIPLPVSP